MLLNSSARIRKFALAAMFVSATLEARPTLEPAGLAAYTETARDIYVAGLLLAPDAGLDNIYLAPGPKARSFATPPALLASARGIGRSASRERIPEYWQVAKELHARMCVYENRGTTEHWTDL